MKVWVVLLSAHYEGSEVQQVCASEESARRWMDAHQDLAFANMYFEVEKFEVLP